MDKVFINAYDIISPLGNSIEQNWDALTNNKTGLAQYDYLNDTLFLGKIKNYTSSNNEYTYLENLLIDIIEITFLKIEVKKDDKDFLLIISTTKGNIDLLKQHSPIIDISRARLGVMAIAIQKYFGFINTPLIISNACVSGVMALSIAKDYIQNKYYKNILVCGADILSDFVIEGFLSFKAISTQQCKPFDKDRNGINLGEAVACIHLSVNNISGQDYHILGSSSSNDANHISGPSRTGDGLSLAIENSFKDAKIRKEDIDFISAHGTATIYNDDMECKAIVSNQLEETPTNSFKSYIGHTLGAAGICEVIFSILSMKNGLLIKSLGFENINEENIISIISNNQTKEISKTLKLSSGFGGCNSVIIISI
jgi:3-oxoacyl-[acyl-carrier-protein] synthase-1